MLAHLPTPITSHQENRSAVSAEIRQRALARLYERRATVDELIESLERYQEERRQRVAPCISIAAARKWS
jgi:hypothetical protein